MSKSIAIFIKEIVDKFQKTEYNLYREVYND